MLPASIFSVPVSTWHLFFSVTFEQTEVYKTLKQNKVTLVSLLPISFLSPLQDLVLNIIYVGKKEVEYFSDVCDMEAVIAPMGTRLSLLFYQLWARGWSTLTISQKNRNKSRRSYRRSKSDILILLSSFLYGMLSFYLLLLPLNNNTTGTCKLECLTEWVIFSLLHTTLWIKDLSFPVQIAYQFT